MRYHHSSLGNPISNELLKGTKQVFLATLPGLDETLVTKHSPPSIVIAKGHLQQERQGLQSTKLQPNPKIGYPYTILIPTRIKVFMAAIIEAPAGNHMVT